MLRKKHPSKKFGFISLFLSVPRIKVLRMFLVGMFLLTFFLMLLPVFAYAETTRNIPQRYSYIGFDYDSIDVIIARSKTAHIDGILAGKREFNNKNVTDAKIREIQAQGIQVFLLWQATNDNNYTRQCTIEEMKTKTDCQFWDVTNEEVATARIAALQSQLNEFPSIDGVQLEEPTIQLTTPPEQWIPPTSGCGCFSCLEKDASGNCIKCSRPPHTRVYEQLSPKLTLFLQRVRDTLNAHSQEMHFTMNSPSLNPSGAAKWCAGLDFAAYDSLGLFDFISLQTGGTSLVSDYMNAINSWKSKFSNTLILPIVYGWDAGLGGTKSRPACIAAGGYSHRDCYNNDFLDAIYNIQAINNSRVSITQVHWPISYDWINNASSYPCSGAWGLASAVGGIPLPILSNLVSTPAFSPAAGTYSSAQNVSISTSTTGATIYYTLDGSDPAASATKAIYASAIPVSSTTTIKAKAFKDGLTPSVTASATYTIAIPKLTSITVSPASVSLAVDAAQTFIAVPKDQYGNPMVIPVNWASNNITIGTINTSGIFTAIGLGTATITASNGPVNGTATAAVSTMVNTINNPGFESGTAPWMFYTNSTGTFTTSSPGYAGTNTAKIALSSGGTNIQLYQTGVSLEPNTKYRLSFAAYSTSGHDLNVNLVKHVSPYTNYGLTFTANLSTSWQAFSTEFTTRGFTNTVNDGRLFFWLAPFVTTKDTYYIDNVTIEAIGVTTPAFSPAAGTYESKQNVAISTATTGATIRYTLDGTTPTETSPIYTTPITISSTTTLKAGAWKTGMTPSSIASAVYTINIPINLALNPGFESDPAVNYAFFGSGTFSWASDYKHAGEKSLKIISSQPTGQFARWISKREQISAIAGKTYTASVWMKTNGLRQYGELLINFWDNSQNYLNKYYISNHATGTTDWTKLTVSGIAPANTKYIRAEFRLYGPGTVWIDDAEVK